MMACAISQHGVDGARKAWTAHKEPEQDMRVDQQAHGRGKIGPLSN